jgi:C1A family cysteine protease
MRLNPLFRLLLKLPFAALLAATSFSATRAWAEDHAKHWTFTVNEQVRAPHALGYVPGRFPAPRSAPAALEAVPLPSRWDWREHKAVNPIRDQGQCGSCWAFGSATVVESAYMIQRSKTVDLSEQQLVSCDTRYAGCDGGDFAADFYVQTGANYEKDYPYKAKSSLCRGGVAPHEKIASLTVLGADGAAPTVEQIKQAIYQYGPVTTIVAASSQSFQYYASGVYNECGDPEIDHMVALVGWDDKDQAWIMRNSWGTSWGEKGYMRIRYTADDGVTPCSQIGVQIGYVKLPDAR